MGGKTKTRRSSEQKKKMKPDVLNKGENISKAEELRGKKMTAGKLLEIQDTLSSR